MPNEQKDPVQEAEHVLNHPGWREPFGSDARRILMSLVVEIKQLRDRKPRIKEAMLDEIQDCDKCDLCEDHHE